MTYFFLKVIKEGSGQELGQSDRRQELFAYVKPSVEGIARREYNSEQPPQLIGESQLPQKAELGRTAHALRVSVLV